MMSSIPWRTRYAAASEKNCAGHAPYPIISNVRLWAELMINPKKRSWRGGRGEFIRPNNVLRANEFAPAKAAQRVEVK